MDKILNKGGMLLPIGLPVSGSPSPSKIKARHLSNYAKYVGGETDTQPKSIFLNTEVKDLL